MPELDDQDIRQSRIHWPQVKITRETKAFRQALINKHAKGEQPRCSDADGALWTSDHLEDRQLATRLCRACELITLCAAAARSRGETWHVWGWSRLQLARQARVMLIYPRPRSRTDRPATQTKCPVGGTG